VGVIGDSTLLHSGITSAAGMAYNRATRDRDLRLPHHRHVRDAGATGHGLHLLGDPALGGGSGGPVPPCIQNVQEVDPYASRRSGPP
jgi:hypothetical protein